MTKRKTLQSFDEANLTLRTLGDAQRQRAKIEQKAQAEIDRIKARAAQELIPADATIKEATALLTRFILSHKDEIEARGAKTARLAFGVIGTRTPPESLKITKGFTESDVIAFIHREFGEDADIYIQTVEKIRRDELKLLEYEQLESLGMHIDQKDVVVIEPAADVPAAVEVA